MDHQTWLEWRRGGIGSSDAAAIMGVSPWNTAYEIWEEKVIGYGDKKENPAMEYGKKMEEVGRIWFENKMDVSLFPDNVIHKEHSWLRASLDGIDIDRKIMLEIKWPDRETHDLAKKGIVPPKYVPQCQHQMLVEDLSSMYYLSCYKDDRIIVEVKIDPDYIKNMFSSHELFWDHVIRKVPPEFTDRDHQSFEDDEDWKFFTKRYLENKKELDFLIDKVEDDKRNMIELTKGRNAKGCRIRLTKSVCKGAVDYQKAIDEYQAKLKEQFPDVILPPLDLESHRKSPFTKWSVRSED